MLKTFSTASFLHTTNTKCAEIFCQSPYSFMILCKFCQIKCFNFEDFTLHFKNVHFENDLLKTEELDIKCNNFLEINMFENNYENHGEKDNVNEPNEDTESINSFSDSHDPTSSDDQDESDGEIRLCNFMKKKRKPKQNIIRSQIEDHQISNQQVHNI